MSSSKHRLFRARDGAHGHTPVTQLELFFDLVFVFAITQLSHRLLEHMTWHGALETLLLFLAVWWVWIHTSWTTNWMNPDTGAVRLMLFAAMLGGLALSSALPEAFGATGPLFAAAYCGIQIGRTLFVLWATRGVHDGRWRNFMRIQFYFLLALPLWIAGAMTPDADRRLLFWAAALAVEYAGPPLMYLTPLLGRSTLEDWDVSGEHMAERCALFVIIALGESILVTGATVAGLEPTAPVVIAFIASFIGSVAMWWVYFDTGAALGVQRIEGAQDAGRIARNVYTYIHMLIVAGIIVVAVADEMMLAHPIGHIDGKMVLVMVGGPMLFLTGNLMFKWMTAGRRWPPVSHCVGLSLLLIAGLWGWLAHPQPLMLGIVASGCLVFTAAWEWFSLHGGYQRWLLGQSSES
jgi:low temperature requirement protein LtrA